MSTLDLHANLILDGPLECEMPSWCLSRGCVNERQSWGMESPMRIQQTYNKYEALIDMLYSCCNGQPLWPPHLITECGYGAM